MKATVEIFPPLPEGTVAPETLYLEGGVKVSLYGFREYRFLDFELPSGMPLALATKLLTVAVGRPCFELGKTPVALRVDVPPLRVGPDPLPELEEELQPEPVMASVTPIFSEVVDQIEEEEEEVVTSEQPECVWDRVFAKRGPVYGLSEWCKSEEASNYVYLPNDLGLSEGFAEESQSNAFYTEVLVTAYTDMCNKFSIRPQVRLWDGTLLEAADATPIDGCQHHVKDEVSSRLANSKLEGFNDWRYRDAFLECLRDMHGKYPYQSEATYVTVLAKCENTLLGRSKHIPNQKFAERVGNYLDRLPHGSATLVTTVMGVCRQMMQEGLVLQHSRPLFEKRVMSAGGISDIADAMRAYDKGYTNSKPKA